MPVCPKCENDVPAGAARCPYDGAPLPSVTHGKTLPAGSTPPPVLSGRAPSSGHAPPSSPAPASSRAPSQGGPQVSAELEAMFSEPQEIVAGTMIGEYEVTGALGEGGMGQVFAAVHPIIGKKVAVKVLSEHVASNREVVRRFVAEARAVNQIGHPNIVDVFAFGQLDDGRQYYVMEHLVGVSLYDELESRRTIPADELVALLGDALDALEAAHQAGIIHRDLKPDNIFLCNGRRRVAKLLDFGIAKLTGDDGAAARTRTGMAMGTPEFMSPEQCRGAGVDHRTDIYALGILLYRALTGVFPFEAASPIEFFYKHTSEEPIRPSEVAPIAEAFERITLRCLEKEPDDRFGSVSELATALQDALENPGPALGADTAAPASVRAATADTLPSKKAAGGAGAAQKTEVVASRRPRKLVLGIAALGAVALAGGGAWYATRAPGEGTAAPAAAADPAAVPDAAAVAVTGPADAAREVAAEQAAQSASDAAPEPAVGGIEIEVNVRRAEVFVDDERVKGRGRTFRVDEIAAGEHEIRVERRGFKTRTRSVEVVAGETEPVEISLRRIRKRRANDRGGDRDRDRDDKPDEGEPDPLVDKDGTIGLPEVMGDPE